MNKDETARAEISIILNELNQKLLFESSPEWRLGVIKNIIKKSENIADENLKIEVRTQAEIIFKINDLSEIRKKLQIIFKALLSKIRLKKYLTLDDIDRTKDYINDSKKYIAYKNLILSTEFKITNSELYNENLHELIKSGTWKDYLHARITKNLRLIYLYIPEEKKIIFTRIITHNELDQN